MSGDFAHRYPNIHRFVFEQGWIEVGYDEYNHSFIRALDPGGTVWEGKYSYGSLDEALADLERGLAQWMKGMVGKGDE